MAYKQVDVNDDNVLFVFQSVLLKKKTISDYFY